ncbi:MAG: hypothetical protein U0166_26925 [Acidobacteriota bacterium]
MSVALAGTAAPISGERAFDKLKSLAGDWEVHGDAMEVAGPVASYRVTAGGTVVMETLMPGTEYEMITMYHMDGDDLLLTHYCSMGNQPRMKLDRKSSTLERLGFAFVDGTGMRRKSTHMHTHEIAFVDPDHVISTWGVSEGDDAPVETKRFSLVRKK